MTLCEPHNCLSVFENVRVGNATLGGSVVAWDLKTSFSDATPHTFTLETNDVLDSEADGWESTGATGVDVAQLTDPDTRRWSTVNGASYRIKLVTAADTYYSMAVPALDGATVSTWRLVRFQRDQIKRTFKAPHAKNAVLGIILKQRVAGPFCVLCADPQTGTCNDPRCPECFGTGRQCGYYTPIGCSYSKPSPKRHDENLDTDLQGHVHEIRRAAQMTADTPLAKNDVWINAINDERYYVESVAVGADIAGIPILYDPVVLRLASAKDAIYTVPVDPAYFLRPPA